MTINNDQESHRGLVMSGVIHHVGYGLFPALHDMAFINRNNLGSIKLYSQAVIPT